MAITLNVIKPTTPVERALKAGYLYKDIHFDISPAYSNGSELYSSKNVHDLKAIYDSHAVVVALKNILTTSPGEKILNPTFGLDLRDYLFETVSQAKAFFLGQTIYDGLTTQEPRVHIDQIEVIAVTDENEYIINIALSIPSLNVNAVSLKGVLNNDGYTFA